MKPKLKQHPKLLGELSEVEFLYRAIKHGLIVSKPYGDNARYDFIVDNSHRLIRLQVKSTSTFREGFYNAHVGRHKQGKRVPYTSKEIDCLALLIVPEARWFFIPVAALKSRTHVFIHPRDSKRPESMLKYEDAWDLLKK